MANSIYDTDSWNSGNTYNKNDIVVYGIYYYYSLIDNNLNQTPTIGSSSWGGMAIDFNGEAKPYFFWRPAYNVKANSQPKTKNVQFGDSYEQRNTDLINNNLKKFELSFDLRTTKEATAILHFLHYRQGVESFLFQPRPPYNKIRRFVCRNWTDGDIFYDNNIISCEFEEVVN